MSGTIKSEPVADTSEATPALFHGAKGEVLRVWTRFKGKLGSLVVAAPTSDSWRTLVEITPDTEDGIAGKPDVAVGPGGELRLAYQWWRRTAPVLKQIRLARSDDGGRTWTQPPAPVDQAGHAFEPKVSWGRDKTLVVVWSDEQRSNRVWDVYARSSQDGGTTWEPERRLSQFPEDKGREAYVRPQLLADRQNNFWVVWVGLRGGGSQLYLNRSTDGGRTWTDQLQLSGKGQTVYGHRILQAGDRLVVIWQDKRTGRDRIYAVSSGDAGATWTAPTRVDHLPDDLATDAFGPAVVASPTGEVLVAWHDGRHGRNDIFVGRSTDGGRTWEDKDTRLDMDEPGVGMSRFATIAKAPDGRIAVAWEDDRNGYEGVYLRVRSAADPLTWGPEIVVEPAGPKKGSRTPMALWGSDGRLYLTWEVWDYSSGPMSVMKQVGSRVLVLDKK